MANPKFSDEDLSRWKREISPAPIFRTRIGDLSRENSEWLGRCPDVFHKKATGHSDNHPSLKLWKLDDGTWGFKCFSCGANGNVFQFVQAFDGIRFTAAVEKVLAEAGGYGWTEGAEQQEVSMPASQPKAVETFPMNQYTPAIAALERSKEGKAWLEKRGIGMATARKMKLGFVQSAEKCTPSNLWMNDGWVLFPTISADAETVIAVKYRSVIAKKDKKTNSGILRAPNTATVLYNAQTVTATDDVWIVEGEPDTVVMAQAGRTAVGYPMSGYKPTDDECDLLSTAKRRFLAGDNDAPGIKAMADLQKRLRGATFVIKWPNNRKDANEVLTLECGNDPAKFKALVDDLQARATQTETEPLLRDGNEIQPKRISWMWHEKIPFGKITLFTGNPDNGKSLATTKVAATVTRGDRFPGADDSDPPADVLMLIGEDDLDDTAVPRLMAAGADMKRIHFLEGVRPVKQEDREVQLDLDLPAIEKQLEKNTRIRLIIIDPISNYLGDVNMIAEQEVRRILVPLKRMAEKYHVAVILVMHLNKKSDLDAISRVGGAMAFIGVARCSWLFIRDPKEDPVEGEPVVEQKPDTFSMLRIKNNLVSAGKAGLSYSVVTTTVPIRGESDITVPFVQWGGAVEGSADEALVKRGRTSEPGTTRKAGRPADSLQQAITWLEQALQDNEPRTSKELFFDAHGSAGISEKTLRRAKESLKIRDFKAGTPAKWYWVMDPVDTSAKSDNADEPDGERSPLLDYGDSRE